MAPSRTRIARRGASVTLLEKAKHFGLPGGEVRGRRALDVNVQVSATANQRASWLPIKTPPAAILLKRAAGIAKASAVPHKDKIGKVTRAQVREIAQTKLVDLNTDSIESAMRTIEGTARSMGIEVQ